MANTTNGSLAAAAAAHLRTSGYTVDGFSCTPEDIERQSACLVEWAIAAKAMLTTACVAGLRKHEVTTAEHEVYYRSSDNRALKITYSGTFGVTPEPKGVQKAATPAFYLHRMELMNEVFRSDFRLEGVLMGRSLLLGADADKPSLVVSQPWMRAADENNPHPSIAEVAEFMERAGFTTAENSYFGWTKGQLRVIDARPDNFIKTSEGVVPIDLVIC